MGKSFVAVLFALIVSVGLIGSAGNARAGEKNCCGPIPPTYGYSTVEKVSHVTHIHDVWHTNYVQRTKLFVHVTRVQPVIYVHNVTRVHDKTVAIEHPVHVTTVEYLPPKEFTSSSVVHINEGCVCNCH